MSTESSLSFEHLVGADRAWSKSLAYWIGPCTVAGLQGVDADGITYAMSYQYDIEEQADRTGHVLPPDADWTEFFTPIAPVQLTRAWSPLPAAIDLLGAPDWISAEPGGPGARPAACAWTSVGVAQWPVTTPLEDDHERFRQLLRATVVRAGGLARGILIAAKPGWSYAHVHAPSPATRKLMEDAGFVVTDRHV